MRARLNRGRIWTAGAVLALVVAAGASVPAGTIARGTLHTYESAAKTKIEGYGRAVPIKVTDSFEVSDVNVGVRIGETATGPAGDDAVLLLLIGPSGETIQLDYADLLVEELHTGPNDCGPGGYFTFDDEGAEEPAEPLSELDGMNAQGTWRLFVRREVGGVPMLSCWQLGLEGAEPKAPKPALSRRGTQTGTYMGDTGAVPDDPCTGGECGTKGRNEFAAFPIPVPDKGKVADVDVKLSITDGDVFDHVGALIGASGEAVELWRLINSDGDNPTNHIGENSACGATLTDGDNKSIQSGGNLNGKLKPRKKLSQLKGSKTKGDWILLIEDSIEHNFGNLHPVRYRGHRHL